MASQPRTGKSAGPREWLFWAAIALSVGEFIDALHPHNDLASGIIYAVLVAGCGWWLRMRNSRIPVVLLLVLSGLELAALIFLYPNSPTPPAPWRSAIFIVLTLAVLTLALLSLFRRASSSEGHEQSQFES